MSVRQAVIVLAAGSSSRLGRPKQLLHFRSKSLLGHTLSVACEAAPGSVYVVLGAQADLFLAELRGFDVHIVLNTGWTEGIASSIRAGLGEVILEGSSCGVIFMVCDQPYLEPLHLQNLIAASATSGKRIAASLYNGSLGTPALFSSAYFDDLLTLQGDAGARKLLDQYSNDVIPVVFEAGMIDVDTPEDYERLLNDDYR